MNFTYSLGEQKQAGFNIRIFFVLILCFFVLPVLWSGATGVAGIFGYKTKAQVVAENHQLRTDLDKVFDAIENNKKVEAKVKDAKAKTDVVIKETKTEIAEVIKKTDVKVADYRAKAREIISKPTPVVSAEAKPQGPSQLRIASINAVWDAYDSLEN